MFLHEIFFWAYLEILLEVLIALFWGWGIFYSLAKLRKYYAYNMLLAAIGCLFLLIMSLGQALIKVPDSLWLTCNHFPAILLIKAYITEFFLYLSTNSYWQNYSFYYKQEILQALLMICVVAGIAGRFKLKPSGDYPYQKLEPLALEKRLTAAASTPDNAEVEAAQYRVIKEYREISEDKDKDEDEDVAWLRETQTHKQAPAVATPVAEKSITSETTLDAPGQSLAEAEALQDEEPTEIDTDVDANDYELTTDEDEDDDEEYQGLNLGQDDLDADADEDEDDDDDDDEEYQGLAADEESLDAYADEEYQNIPDAAGKEKLQGVDHEKAALGLKEFFAQQQDIEDEDPTVADATDEKDPSWLDEASITAEDQARMAVTCEDIPQKDPSWLEDTSAQREREQNQETNILDSKAHFGIDDVHQISSLERPESTPPLDDQDPSWLEDGSVTIEREEEEYLWGTDEVESPSAPQKKSGKAPGKKKPLAQKQAPAPDDWEDFQGDEQQQARDQALTPGRSLLNRILPGELSEKNIKKFEPRKKGKGPEMK